MQIEVACTLAMLVLVIISGGCNTTVSFSSPTDHRQLFGFCIYMQQTLSGVAGW